MQSPPIRQSGYARGRSLRSRLAAIMLSLAILALFVVVLLRLGALPQAGNGANKSLVSVDLSPSGPTVPHPAHARTHASRPVLPVPHPEPSPQPQLPPIKLIHLSSSEFAASDIAGLPRHPEEAADDNAGGGGSGSAMGPGEGPGGARLYNAEWVREPTNAELAGYMPNRSTAGEWAMIACKTIEHFHVEDCQELGESEPGAGVARALRQAAWQFLVRPPRINGRPVIGSWVRIRFDFTRGVH